MIEIEIELLEQIKVHYANLQKVSDVHFVYRGNIMVTTPANRDLFIAYFDELIISVASLVSLNVDYATKQTLWDFNVLKNQEVESLRNIKYSDSVKIEQNNVKKAEDAMQNIVSRLKNKELSSILEMIDS